MILSTILQGKQNTFRENCHPRLQRNARKLASTRHTNTRFCYGHSAVPQPNLRPNRTERLLSHVHARPRRQAREGFVNEQARQPKCKRQSARYTASVHRSAKRYRTVLKRQHEIKAFNSKYCKKRKKRRNASPKVAMTKDCHCGCVHCDNVMLDDSEMLALESSRVGAGCTSQVTCIVTTIVP